MTVWERIDVIKDEGTQPNVFYQNWGKNLDGASLITAVVQIAAATSHSYGHDFTIRAGSMDATNAQARQLDLPRRQRGMPLIGMNDSAGAYVPAASRPRRLRRGRSRAPQDQRIVPSVMCMFGYNAGAALSPAPGRLHDPARRHVLRPDGAGSDQERARRDVTPDDLADRRCTARAASSTSRSPTRSARSAPRALAELPTELECRGTAGMEDLRSDDRPTTEIDVMLRKAFNSPTGFNTPDRRVDHHRAHL